MCISKVDILEDFSEKGIPVSLSDACISKVIDRSQICIDSYLRSASFETPVNHEAAINPYELLGADKFTRVSSLVCARLVLCRAS
jgi:hypothetical protein